MKVKINRTLWVLIVGISLGMVLLVGQAQATIATFGLDATNSTVYVYGANAYGNFTDMNNSFNQNRALLNLSNGSEWLLNINITVNGSSTTFFINKTDTTILRINTTSTMNHNLTCNGKCIIDNVTVLPWDNITKSTYVSINSSNLSIPNSYIRANGINSRMNITNSNISYLGYNAMNLCGVDYDNSGGSIIDNVTITGNYMGICMRASANNITANNTKIYNSTYRGFNVNTVSDITLSNSTIDNTSQAGLRIESSTVNITVKNNIVSNSLVTNANVYITQSGNVTFSNNTVFGGRVAGVDIFSSRFINLNNNTLYNNSYHSIQAQTQSSYIRVENNTMYWETSALNLVDSNNSVALWNNISNMTTDFDGWDAGMIFTSTNNITTQYNNLTRIGNKGFSIRNSTNVWILNNYIDMISDDDGYNNTNTNGANEYASAISISPLYKGYFNGSETQDYGRTQLATWNSSNITIDGNTYSSNVKVLLATENVINITANDISNYWISSWEFPRLTYRTTLYISNNFDSLTHIGYNATRAGTVSRSINNVLCEEIAGLVGGNANGHNRFYNYMVSKSSFSIQPQGFYKITSNGTIQNNTDYPYDFWLYTPAYTPFFGSGKNVTIFSNGSTYLQIWNDTVEPNSYSTINASITPSSGSTTVNVTTWNTTSDYYKKVNATGNSNTAWIIGDNPINNWMNVSVNGTTTAIKSNSTGYLSFGIDLTGLGESQIEISVDANPPGLISQNCVSTEGNVNAGFMLLGVLMVIFSVSGIVMSLKSNESMNPVMIGAFFAILVIGSSLIYIGYAVIAVLEGTTC